MEKIKFAVFTDLHYDHIYDGYRRMKDFITQVREVDVDFIVEVQGMEGNYQTASPKELGKEGSWNGREIKASITSFKF